MAVETPRKKAKPSPSKSKSATPSPSKVTQKASPFGPSSSQSAKSKLAEIIMECGIKNFSRQEAQIRTGFTPAQQKEMLNPGRGSLRKALNAAIEKL